MPESQSIPAFKVFPTTDHLGLDILRLMAAYNDIGFVRQWVVNAPQTDPDPIWQALCYSRLDMLLRLMVSFVHEAFEVLDQLERQAEFAGLVAALDEEGRAALQSLRDSRGRLETLSPQFMARVRNKAAFHYIRPEFSDGLKALKAEHGEKFESILAYPDHSAHFSGHFFLCDQVRSKIIFGDRASGEESRIIEEVMNLELALSKLVITVLGAYIKFRGLNTGRV